ncbi:hypothetical protein [Streptomyces sp. NPDC046261]|uniref:hypothetical protein n=1 Tax=Streptomyces sp. NPDC046261 TaxID=3157200 RepID=UPI0033CFC010
MSARETAAPMANRFEERAPSMRDLLASCAAADAVSTPPKAPAPGPAAAAPEDGPETGERDQRDRREAA